MQIARILQLCGCLLTVLTLSGCNSADQTSDGSQAASTQSGQQWVSAWGATHENFYSFTLAPRETTVRNIARITAGGTAVRLRLFNLDPERPVHIGAAAIGIRQPGTQASLVPGSNKVVTFGGNTMTVIPPDTPSFYSDPIEMDVSSQDDLAISLYIAGNNSAHQYSATWHHSYKLPNESGNATLDDSGDGFGLIDGMPTAFPAQTPIRCSGCRAYALRDVEVITEDATGAMVFLGSSSFHGANTSQNGFARVSDLISQRIQNEIPDGHRHTVVNRAISGDTLEAAYAQRMELDVWSTQGIKSVIVWVTNDLEERSANEIIETYRNLIADAKERNVKVYCPTWLPGAQNLEASFNGERAALNDWILNSGECDGVVDYNALVEAPGGFTFLPQYNSGDSIHSNDAGHAVWAGATPISDWILGNP